MPRPKYPRTDGNHYIVLDAINELNWELDKLSIGAVDTSKMGGLLLDWLVWIGPLAVSFEVKDMSGKGWIFTKDELVFLDTYPVPRVVVTTKEDVITALKYFLPMARAAHKTIKRKTDLKLEFRP